MTRTARWALARLRNDLLARSKLFVADKDLELVLGLIDRFDRELAARGRGSTARRPPARVVQLDAVIVEELERATGFGSLAADDGVTTDELVAVLRRRGFKVSDDTVRRRALELARAGRIRAKKQCYFVAQTFADEIEPHKRYGGEGRCLRQQWRFWGKP
jgi:hypothetical protein